MHYHLLHHDIRSLEDDVAAVVSQWKKTAPLAPCHVIVPHETALGLWKRTLQRHLRFYFNLEVWTPHHLYTYLRRTRNLIAPQPLKTDAWAFLMQMHWERHFPDMEPTALRKSTHTLSHAFQTLIRCGHLPECLKQTIPQSWQAVFASWLKSFSKLAQFSQAYQERFLLKNPDASPLSNHHLVLLGFDSSHLNHLPLLSAALRYYEHAAVFTFLPSDVNRNAQQHWIRWCEAQLPQASTSFSKNAEDAIIDEPTLGPRSPSQFIFSANMRSLAEKICLWSQRQLESGHERVAIILPNQSRLAPYMCHLFRLRKISFYSEFPTYLPLRFDQLILEAWLRLQTEDLLIPTFLDFWKAVHTVPTWQALFASEIPSPSQLERRLDRLWKDTGENNLQQLRLEMNSQEDAALIQCIEAWKSTWQWPHTAPLEDYVARLLSQIDFLIGPNIGREIRSYLHEEVSTLCRLAPAPLSKALAIDRFKTLLLRLPEAEQKPTWPFIHILTPQSAQNLAWDAILCAELYEGMWPSSSHYNPWLERELVTSLNAQSNNLDRFLLPHPNDAFALELEHFQQLFNLASKRLDFAMAFCDESHEDASLTPSLFFTQAWQEVTGKPFDRATQQQIKADVFPMQPKARRHIFLEAHTRRRDKTLPFDGYCFMLAKPARKLEYSVTQCEEILASSELAWYRLFLRCEQRNEDWSWEALKPLFRGTLIHRWLSLSLRGSIDSSGNRCVIHLDRAVGRLRELAEKDYHALVARYQAAQRPVPYHWSSVFRSFENHAADLLRLLKPILSSFELEKADTEIKLGASKNFSDKPWSTLLLKGKIDLLIRALDEADRRLTLIIDYKTGDQKDSVCLKDILKQTHFQLLGYAALAYEADREVQGLLLSRYHRPAFLSIDPLDPQIKGVWKRLTEKIVEGRWGYELNPKTRNLDALPLAHLQLPKAVLKAKHALTFGPMEVEDDGDAD